MRRTWCSNWCRACVRVGASSLPKIVTPSYVYLPRARRLHASAHRRSCRSRWSLAQSRGSCSALPAGCGRCDSLFHCVVLHHLALHCVAHTTTLHICAHVHAHMNAHIGCMPPSSHTHLKLSHPSLLALPAAGCTSSQGGSFQGDMQAHPQPHARMPSARAVQRVPFH